MGRRILITGLSSFWGGRLALAFEQDPAVEVIVGMDTADPVVALERTEFVRTDEDYSLLARLVRATQVDTVVHAALIVDSSASSDRRIHEFNVIGTMNLLAAAAAPDSRVSALVVKSSTLVYGCSGRDPNWFREDSPRRVEPRTAVERSLVEVEGYLRSFAAENRHIKVAVLRCANVLGEDLVTPLSKALSSRLIPTIGGFDPQVQFVEQGDVIRAIEFVMAQGLEGVYNLAADGRLPWSEIRALAGRRPLLLSPLFTGLGVAPLSRLGFLNLPPETLDLLRFGRGVDNRKLKNAGFSYRFSTAGAVRHFVEADRLRRVVGETEPTYRYQADVESFFRHSPAVVRN
jgi:UDP-glucose 4-epimerase